METIEIKYEQNGEVLTLSSSEPGVIYRLRTGFDELKIPNLVGVYKGKSTIQIIWADATFEEIENIIDNLMNSDVVKLVR